RLRHLAGLHGDAQTIRHGSGRGRRDDGLQPKLSEKLLLVEIALYGANLIPGDLDEVRARQVYRAACRGIALQRGGVRAAHPPLRRDRIRACRGRALDGEVEIGEGGEERARIAGDGSAREWPAGRRVAIGSVVREEGGDLLRRAVVPGVKILLRDF